MICIVPLDKNMSKSFLKNIKLMCEAFFYGSKVKILPSFSLQDIPKVDKRQIFDDETQTGAIQYNASKILSWLFRVYKPAN